MIQPPTVAPTPVPQAIAAPAPVQKQVRSPSRDKPLTAQAVDAVDKPEPGKIAERRRRTKSDRQLDVSV